MSHIDRERLNVYQLLAGHVDAVIPVMDLDWRRALGLHLWYALWPYMIQPDLAFCSRSIEVYVGFKLQCF